MVLCLPIAAVLTGSATSYAAVSGANRFTLACTGSRDSNGQTTPYNFKFRVDLSARKWCDANCDDVRTFAKIERDRLTFSESETGTFTEWSYIDRRTGEYTQVFRSDLLRTRVKATCERAAYKPITYRARKF